MHATAIRRTQAAIGRQALPFFRRPNPSKAALSDPTRHEYITDAPFSDFCENRRLIY